MAWGALQRWLMGRAPATSEPEEKAAPAPAPDDGRPKTPMYLQRSGDGVPAAPPGPTVTPPSPSQPPRAGLPINNWEFRLDPELEAWNRTLAFQLDPSAVAAAAARVPLLAGSPSPPPVAAPDDQAAPPPTPAPPAPVGATTPPAPAADEEHARQPTPPIVIPGARPFSLGVLLQDPAAQAALDRVKAHGLEQWERLKTGEKATVIGFGALVVGTGLGPALADPRLRSSIVGALNGRIFPVPFTPVNVEINVRGNDFLLGFHVDVGKLLPPSFGFRGGLGASPLRDALPVSPPMFKRDPSEIAADAPPPEDLAGRIEAERSAGAPLGEGVRARLESALGANLSAVRVHDDATADELARSVHARAFTSGNDIFLRAGEAEPTSSGTLPLLAHEATHTLQQAAGPVSGRPTGAGFNVSDPADAFEREADRAAYKVSSATPPPAVPRFLQGRMTAAAPPAGGGEVAGPAAPTRASEG